MPLRSYARSKLSYSVSATLMKIPMAFFGITNFASRKFR